MRLQFPHISRFFSASVLWGLLLAFVGLNAFAAANYPLAYSDKLFSEALGREITVSQVLGATAKDEQHRDYWKQIVKEHPDYRDAYIALAYIAYKEGETQEAVSYIHEASDLDPNNPTVEALVKFISQEAQ